MRREESRQVDVGSNSEQGPFRDIDGIHDTSVTNNNTNDSSWQVQENSAYLLPCPLLGRQPEPIRLPATQGRARKQRLAGWL